MPCFFARAAVLARLASIFLQEEKGRIHRLRQIKSVLASGRLMGNVGGNTSSSSMTQPARRGKRRPLPNASEHHSYHTHHTAHRRFQHADVKPHYPANPFGNVGSDIQQFPTPMGRRSSLEEALRGGRNEVNAHAQHRNSMDRSEMARGDDRRAIADQVSALGGSTQSLYGSRSDLVRTNNAAPDTTGDKNHFLHSQHKEGLISSNQADEKGQLLLQGLVSHNTSRVLVAEENHAISSGQSAIDLFDQCGIVPMAAVEKEGLVGTTSTYNSSRESGKHDSTGRNNLGTSTTDDSSPRYPITAATVAPPRPPLVPGGTSSTIDFRGAGNHPRDAGRGSAMRTQAAATHGVRPRPLLTNSGASTSSRAKLARQQAPSLSSGTEAVAGTSRPHGKLRRGVPKDATMTDSSSRRSRMVPRLNSENRYSAETTTSIPKPDRRTRRRWNVDAASPTGASSNTPAPPGVAAVAEAAAAAGIDAVESESTSAFASEQRIASAKERLHKNKDLEALKSEHVEALSILQDISCPSTAAVALEATRGESVEEDGGGDGKTKSPESAVEATRRCLLYERNNSSTTTTGGSRGRGVAPEGVPADVEVDKLSADLPRIGSEEQATLRAMYRKWWMKVANGGSPPSLGTPAGLLDEANNVVEGDNANLTDSNLVGERGNAPVVGQRRAGTTDVGQEEGQAGRTASDVRNIEVVNGAEEPESVARTEPEKKLSESEKSDLVRPRTPRGAEACVLEKSDDGSKTSLTELEGTRANDGIITNHCKEPATSVGAEVGTTGVPKAGAATGGEPESTSSKEEAANTEGSILLHTSAGVPPTKDGAVGGTGSASSSPGEQQAAASDVDSVSEDDGLEKEQEEGHHGRIYLADGRFVSTWRNNAEAIDDAVEHLKDLGIVDGSDNRTGSSCEVVVDESAAKGLDDVSMGYADEDFEFED